MVFLNGNETMPVLGTILVGSLIAFIYYNLFSRHQKIFMGDTGSLLIGFFVAVFAVRFMEANAHEALVCDCLSMSSAPAVTLGILIVPIIDTLRVFFRRISRGQSPFAADKSHVHHRLLTLGFNHLQITLSIGTINLLFILFSFWLKDFGTVRLLALNLLLGWIIFQSPSLFIYRRRKELMHKRHVINKDK